MFELMGMALPQGQAGPYPGGNWWHAATFFDEMLGLASKMSMRACYELSLIDDSDRLRTMVYPTHNRSTSEILVLRQACWLDIEDGGTRVTRGLISAPEDGERALDLAVRSGESDVIGAYLSVLPATGVYLVL
ncbi:hypothetical protein L3Q67_01870 [Saccharothrix sp. AJ9571]|nr:hypothetical protein L3Q67_01870 [Saccharothrix sp. AJ9571]